MNTRTLSTIAAVLALAAGLAAQTDPNTLSLTLEEALLRAMKNNLSVAIGVLGPESARESVARAEEKFLPTLGMDFSTRNTSNASYSFLDARDNVQNKSLGYAMDIGQSVPFGGSLTLSIDNSRNETTQSFQTINPRYSSTMRLNFSQPLLRNFGLDLSRREILIARNSAEMSDSQLETTLANTIYSVEEAYWNLVYNIRILEVRRQSLELAKDLLAKNRRSVEIGTMAPMDVVSAEAEVATREADILQSEAQVKSSEDRLKVLLNFKEADGQPPVTIVPVDEPSFESRMVSLDEALATALQNRPDLRSTRVGLKTESLNLSYAKNQLLPTLNLTASYWSPGISGDRILYEGGNALTGKVIGTVPGGISDAYKDVFGFRYQNWSVGLTLDVPLANMFSKANYAIAQINMKEALLSLENQEQQIILEVKSAVRAVETNYKRIQAYRLARELAERKLGAEAEKLRVGMSTNYMVLSYQRDLANARTTELNSIVTYNLALAALDRSLGTTLQAKGMRLTDFLPDDD